MCIKLCVQRTRENQNPKRVIGSKRNGGELSDVDEKSLH